MDLGAFERPRRPMLKAGLALVPRGPTTVQFGLDPDRAVLLTDVDPALLSGLGRLDGAHDPADLAAALRIHGGHLEAVLDELAAAGLLDDAAVAAEGWRDLPLLTRDRLGPDLASLTLAHPGPHGGKRALSRRLRAAVEIRGGGRVGAAAAGLLGAAGVGHVRVIDEGTTGAADLGPAGLAPEDVGIPRGRAATRAAARLTGRSRRRARSPDLVLLADLSPLADAADDLMRAGTPHLIAAVRDTEGIVGPLVLPGRTSCLRCHDLVRADRDETWPHVAAYLRSPQRADRAQVRPCDVVLATAVAAHAVLEVLTFLDEGTAGTADATLHLPVAGGAMRRRSWPRHPACGCAWADVTAS